MQIPYWRYSATGNTFLIFDNRKGILHEFSKDTYCNWSLEKKVDGILFLESPRSEDHDFHMRYLNADGGEVEMCGNGARSIIHFAYFICNLESKADSFVFSTMCATYSGYADSVKGFPLAMNEVGAFDQLNIDGLLPNALNSSYLFTGVPHCCFEVNDLAQDDLMSMGREIRYNPIFEKGCNVNFYKVQAPGHIEMRTYERGVEAETDSCGTGATAVGLCAAKKNKWKSPVNIKVPGGELLISFSEDFKNVFLSGAVELLSEGVLELKENDGQ